MEEVCEVVWGQRNSQMPSSGFKDYNGFILQQVADEAQSFSVVKQASAAIDYYKTLTFSTITPPVAHWLLSFGSLP